MERFYEMADGGVWFPHAALQFVREAVDRELQHPLLLKWGRIQWRPRLVAWRDNHGTKLWAWRCACCNQIKSRHDYGRLPKDCTGYIPHCIGCLGWGPSADNRQQLCRHCRRLFKRKEHELWLARIRTRNEMRTQELDLERWREGRRYLNQVRRLLNPEPLKSPAGASVPEPISQTS